MLELVSYVKSGISWYQVQCSSCYLIATDKNKSPHAMCTFFNFMADQVTVILQRFLCNWEEMHSFWLVPLNDNS